MDNMFEEGIRLRLRFNTPKGILNTEDVYHDLKLEELNSLAKALNKEKKEAGEEDFIKVKSNANTVLELKFEIVKYVIGLRLAEKEARAVAAAKKARKAQLLEAYSKAEGRELEGMTKEQIAAMIDEV